MGCGRPARGPPARRPSVLSLRTVSPLQARAVLRAHWWVLPPPLSPQSCPTLCGPTDGSPPGSPSLGSPGGNPGVGCHGLLHWWVRLVLKSNKVSLSTQLTQLAIEQSWIFNTVPTNKRWNQSRSVVSDSLQPHGLYSPWNSLGQNTSEGAFPFSRGSSQPRDRTLVSRIAGGFFTSWAIRHNNKYKNKENNLTVQKAQ